jgi:beta-xylosidase
MNYLAASISRGVLVLFAPLIIWIYPVHPIKKTIVNHYSDTTQNTYANPVVPGDFPDPSVIRVGSTYYASGTSSEWGPHFPLFVSKDLVNWKQKGYIFKKKPEWALSSFWAPELFYHNKIYYVYYVAKRASDKVACIGVATSTNPEKGFTDHGVIVDYGTESIDPFIVEDNGQLYIIWKAYGLDKRPIELLASKISADGLKMEGKPFSLLRDDNRKGMEGASMLKKDGYYYLFYSAGACCGIRCDYNVRVARATSFKGPYTYFEGNPLLTANDKWKCPGHGTFVETPAGKTYFLYHAYNRRDNIYTGREGMLDELAWDAKTNWPYFKNGNSPSISAALPVRRARQVLENGLTDNFTGPVLADFWQWDYRHSKPVTKLKKGELCLSGEVDTVNNTGIALTVRPESGTYEMSTGVLNTNASLKGLVLYGDVNHAIGIGVSGNKVQLWEVTNKERKIWADQIITSDKPVRFKMTVKDRTNFKFYWSQDTNTWNELSANNPSYDGKSLPAWDRSARPGLHYYGKADSEACFGYFKIAYTK